MKNNEKGFTLIELLAVIVILAIIALIATPIVLNMIKNARRSAAKSSTLGYIDSVNNFIPLSEAAKDLELKDEDYKNAVIPPGECVKENDVWKTDKCREFYTLVDKKTKGSKPTDIKITIENHQVKEGATFTTNKFQCSYQNNDVTCGDNEISSNAPSTPQKVWTAVTGDGTNVGDEINITGTNENFYVISNSNGKINALAKYNLNVGDNKNPDVTEGIQDESVKGWISSGVKYGNVSFSESITWTTGEDEIEAKATGTLHDALENYKTKLPKGTSVRLITKKELEELECDIDFETCSGAPEWVYSTSYWSGAACDYDGHVRVLRSDGTYYNEYIDSYYNRYYGVRPVITIDA